MRVFFVLSARIRTRAPALITKVQNSEKSKRVTLSIPLRNPLAGVARNSEQQPSAIRSCSFAVLVLPRPLLSGSKQARGRLRGARAAGWPSYFWVNAAIRKGGLVTAQKARPLKKCCSSGTETTGPYAQLSLFPESTLPPNVFAFASCKTVALNFS